MASAGLATSREPTKNDHARQFSHVFQPPSRASQCIPNRVRATLLNSVGVGAKLCAFPCGKALI